MFIHHLRPIPAKVEIIRLSRDVLQVSAALPVSLLFDLPLEFAEQAFFVVHGKIRYFRAEAIGWGDFKPYEEHLRTVS
jgi:hypothetical protein